MNAGVRFVRYLESMLVGAIEACAANHKGAQVDVTKTDEENARERPIRTDVKALRGIAVCLVILYHAHIGFAGGFLGVDIFFVISGYLITGIITTAISHQRFSFAQFYFRRAKRLLPAAYTSFLSTTLLAPLFLTSTSSGRFAIN